MSSSIARAKEKIQMMEQKKNVKDYREAVLMGGNSSNVNHGSNVVNSRSVEKRESNITITQQQANQNN